MKFSIMDQTGHSTEVFDKADAADQARAKARFKELVGRGFAPATRTAEGHSRRVKAFDPAAEDTLFVPPLVGG